MSVDAHSVPSPVEPNIVRASHLPEENEELIQLTGEVVSARKLHYVGHFTRGFFDFSIDVLADVAGALPSERDVERQREWCRWHGRQMNFLADRLDRQLQTIRSGRLIRTVLEADNQSVHHYQIRTGQYFVGYAFDSPGLQTADRLMADLTNEVRARYRLGSQNPGGYLTQGEGDWILSEFGNSPHVEGFIDESTTQSLVREFSREAVDPQRLHYAAYYDGGAFQGAVDVFSAPQLKLFFDQISRKDRRIRYREIGSRLDAMVRSLEQSMYPVTAGALNRLVLDVEEGALFYNKISTHYPGSYVIGVTVDKSRVADADARVQELSEQIALRLPESSSEDSAGQNE
ncbi:hypothetical protein [Cryptosporangium arvum]|uniref:Uncharacterized protein n=1 Tax=Cryptosporangium arvum DSM 44712 TaxID=927661 RepID=A0A011ABU6_9ACTN|nr:hypothetical protein [Cryptosporangium arvum]EXG79501.1 hypothetical protein CryarDRAFT_0542 [Cryptosporangium arvum DSM 44712]